LAASAIAQHLPEYATQLYGAASALREAIGSPLPPVERDAYERSLAAARAQLGDAAFNAAGTAGRKLSLEHAFKLALEKATT
jgi:hypothetical protein